MQKKENLNIPVVSDIIERVKDGKTEILVQTRWKPDRDSQYSGTLEISAGWIDRYENVYDALRREVKEETGLTITDIIPNKQTKLHKPNKDGAFAFQTFCCQQQIKGGNLGLDSYFCARLGVRLRLRKMRLGMCVG